MGTLLNSLKRRWHLLGLAGSETWLAVLTAVRAIGEAASNFSATVVIDAPASK